MVKIADKAEMLRWLRDEGMTNADAVQRYSERGVSITSAAVSMFRGRHGVNLMVPRHYDLVPWANIREEHRTLLPVKMLRAEGRRRQGKELSETEAKELDRWLVKMAEANAVVMYEPDTLNGWHYVRRRQGIDLDLVRDPRLGDDGASIANVDVRVAGGRRSFD